MALNDPTSAQCQCDWARVCHERKTMHPTLHDMRDIRYRLSILQCCKEHQASPQLVEWNAELTLPPPVQFRYALLLVHLFLTISLFMFSKLPPNQPAFETGFPKSPHLSVHIWKRWVQGKLKGVPLNKPGWFGHLLAAPTATCKKGFVQTCPGQHSNTSCNR
jgi:hypothetical protein